jgi:hypothetical protein
VKAALDHRLAGTLYHIKAPLGESDTLVCRSAWADQLGAHLLRVEALSRIWPREAPPPLIFKGADLAENLYNDPGARQARDLDLLVPPSAFDGLVRHLARSADQLERPRHERFAHDREHAVGLRFGPLLIVQRLKSSSPPLCCGCSCRASRGFRPRILGRRSAATARSDAAGALAICSGMSNPRDEVWGRTSDSLGPGPPTTSARQSPISTRPPDAPGRAGERSQSSPRRLRRARSARSHCAPGATRRPR